MEIYAQQQQLQQYSNQRAQLSPTQVQQMYIMRNSRSNPSLTSAATTVAATTTASSAGNPAPMPVLTNSDAVSGQDTNQSPLSPKDDPSSALPLSAAGQVTVMFESTSFSVQDPNHPNYVGKKNSTAQAPIPTPVSGSIPPTLTGASGAMSSGSAVSLPSLASASSSLSSASTGASSPSFPGNYPGSSTPSNNNNGANKKSNA
ncbi:hypothetical protein BGZ96_000785 [Linnemannia gamsii]|uniref:Uncharacterized protein n=1 Tax=Linnemannia gamsii TaxID=64522 RepID=A0ABQ7JNG3_9FUNG|nr:hypothetical protein BGZ96_000785 [Linnemannia gamsii]